MGEKNPRKLMLMAAAVVVVLIIIIGLFAFSAGKKDTKKPSAVKELTVWTVGLDTQALASVADKFKLAYPQYAGVVFTAKKFASYAEYERILPRAIADGNSPDVITVTNDGGWNTLGNYVERLPASVINPVQFRKDFPTFLVEDLLLEDTQDVAVGAVDAVVPAKKKQPAETRTEILSLLKGVPLGYETLAVFYNSRKMRGVPTVWSGFPEMVQDTSSAGSGSDFSPLGIGLGTFVPGSPDIFALLLAQQGIRSPKALASASRVLDTYQSFANSPENGLAQFVPQMRADGLTVLDLFLRGKVGAVIGFPSLSREIEYAAKRAGTGESKIILRSIRAAAVPQAFTVPLPSADSGSGAVDVAKQTLSMNLVRYRYLALSKFSQHADVAADFLAYLASKPGQESIAKSFLWMIPAHREVSEAQLRTPIAQDWKVTKESFVDKDTDLVSFDKLNPVAWDSRLPLVLDGYDIDSRKLLTGFSTYLTCIVNQDAGKGYDTACLPAGQ